MILLRWAAVLPLLLTGVAAPAIDGAPPASAALTLSGTGPYHRLDLSLGWQAQSPRGDLSDVRVVNAAGEALPHAWMPVPVTNRAESAASPATRAGLEGARARPAWSWSGRIRATQCGARHCDYPVPDTVPLGRLKVHLAQVNTLLILNVQGLRPTPAADAASVPVDDAHQGHRHGLRDRLRALRDKSRNADSTDRRPVASQDWVEAAGGQVHWIDAAGQVTRRDELPLDDGRYRMLRLSAPQGDAGWVRTPPEIEVGTWVRSLVFLARGPGPLRLEWTDTHDRSTEVSLAQLMPVAGVKSPSRLGRATLPERPTAAAAASTRVVASPSARSQPATARPGDGGLPIAVWLWGALLLGLGLLAWMVRKVLLEPAPPDQ